MNSIAIWWPDPTEGQDVDLHLDANLWLDKDSKQDYIEFGLKLENPSISEIYIYLPFIVKKEKIKDKIEKLSDSTLSSALFNEKMSITPDSGGCYDVKYSSGPQKGKSFRYCQLNQSSDISIENITDNKLGTAGSKLTISLNKKKSSNSDYYRFRITVPLKKLTTSSNENVFIIDGLVKKVSFVEFCINSPRKLPAAITGELEAGHKIRSMNLFFMTDVLTSFVFESKKVRSTRMLESHIWNEYLGRTLKDGSVIANHWKKGESGEDGFHEYDLFVKIRRPLKAWWRIASAIAAILILGTAAGIAGNFSTKGIDSLGSDNQLAEVASDNTNGDKSATMENNITTDSNEGGNKDAAKK